MSDQACPIVPGDHVIEHEQIHLTAHLPHFAVDHLGLDAHGANHGVAPHAGTVYPCAVSGISLTDYSQGPEQKGWGAHCTGPFTTITASNGVQVTVDSRIAELTTLLFNETLRRGYAIRPADTGAYNCRYIAGTTVWSNHAWGLAIDINWNTNPQKSPLTTDEPAWMLQLWNRYGFAWGGNYNAPTLPDSMHHEFLGTPAQAVAATDLARSELTGTTTTTTYTVQGAIKAHYDDPALNLHTLLGPPITNETTCPDGVGKFNHFQNHGSIYWTPSTGAWAVYGAIRDLWQNLGWETSSLGYPLNDEHDDNGGRRNDFQGGYIWWSAATGAQLNTGGSGGTTTGKLPPAEKSPITGTVEVPGYDCSYSKPSPTSMKSAGYLFVIGYVSPTSGKNLSVAQYNAARSAGLAVGLVWESTAGRAVTGGGAGGTSDGQAAESQANALGYPKTAPLFFAVDQDTTSADYPAIQAYANAFNAATSRPVGIYGEADVIDHFVTPGAPPVRYGWQTVAWSGGRVSTKANLYQRVGHPGWPVPSGVASTDFDEDVALSYVPLAGW